MTESPWNDKPQPSELRVTIKFGKEYDAPWVTVGGNNNDELRENLRQLTGATEDDIKDIPTLAIIANANKEAAAFWVAARQLGGTAIPSGGGQSAKPESAAGKPETASVSAPESAPAQEEGSGAASLLETIEAELAECSAIADINKVWAKYKNEYNTVDGVKPLFIARNKQIKES